MPRIEVKGLSKGFGNVKVLKDMSFSVKDGEYVIVLGPSGCGKTTLLKTIAGLYAPDSGQVLIDGVDVTGRPPEKRGIGFFFQHYSLFPHMSVRQNVGYSLEVQNIDKSIVRQTVDKYLGLVGLLEWAKYRPKHLSGGMQQRVALARALATGSKVLLLDEPLNALDAKIATMLRRELCELSSQMGLTVIHVTPNQEEAMELADRIILINDGRIVQEGSDVEVYTQPRTPYAAYFIGESNFIKARRSGPHELQYRHHKIHVLQDVLEDEVILCVRVEKVRLEHHEHNCIEGVVESVNFLGNSTRLEVNCNGRLIHVETSKHPEIREGDRVHAYLAPEDILLFSAKEPLDDDITVI
jgi:ABC-type Fe3+/spermidine/putrescine transport system ATPase subunit